MPSGLERVRWKLSAFSPTAFDDGEDFRAARDRVIVIFEHERRRAFRQHEAVAVFRERARRALRRGVVGRERRQEREAHDRFRGDRTVGADRKRRIAFAALDRLEAELDRGRAGRAGRGQRNRRALRAEMLGEIIRDDAVFRRLVEGMEFRLRRRAHEIAIFDLVIRAGRARRARSAAAIRFRSAGRRERRGPGNCPSSRCRIPRSPRCRQGARAFRTAPPRCMPVFEDMIDGAGDGGAQAVGRKARDGADAGFARGQLLPVVDLAGAERSDDAHAGDGDDRPSLAVAP